MVPLRLDDTNILISAALKPEGLQRTVILLAITKPARWYISPAIFLEYREVLTRPEFNIRNGTAIATIATHQKTLVSRHTFPRAPHRD